MTASTQDAQRAKPAWVCDVPLHTDTHTWRLEKEADACWGWTHPLLHLHQMRCMPIASKRIHLQHTGVHHGPGGGGGGIRLHHHTTLEKGQLPKGVAPTVSGVEGEEGTLMRVYV